MCLPCNIEHLSIIESGISDQATAPFVLKKTYLTQYTQLRYVAFIGNGYSWRFDPSTNAPLKTPQTIEDRRKPAISESEFHYNNNIF